MQYTNNDYANLKPSIIISAYSAEKFITYSQIRSQSKVTRYQYFTQTFEDVIALFLLKILLFIKRQVLTKILLLKVQPVDFLIHAVVLLLT